MTSTWVVSAERWEWRGAGRLAAWQYYLE